MNLRWSAFCFFIGTLGAQTSDSIFQPGIDSTAPPMTVKDKLGYHGRRFGSPTYLLGIAAIAGIQQWENTPSEWGRGADGYGKRYGNDIARFAIREGLYFGLDTALHEDPRFHRSQKTSFIGRAFDAGIQAVYCHKDGGGRTANVAGVASAFGAGQISALWMPKGHGATGDGLVYGGLLIVGDAGRNVFREFWPDIRRKLKH